MKFCDIQLIKGISKKKRFGRKSQEIAFLCRIWRCRRSFKNQMIPRTEQRPIQIKIIAWSCSPRPWSSKMLFFELERFQFKDAVQWRFHFRCLKITLSKIEFDNSSISLGPFLGILGFSTQMNLTNSSTNSLLKSPLKMIEIDTEIA